MKSFGDTKPPIEFEVSGQKFTAAGDCPGEVYVSLAQNGAEGTGTLAHVAKFFDAVLLDDGPERFAAGLHDRVNPISFFTAVDVFNWLIVEYTGGAEKPDRPTEAQPSSPDGSGTTGQSSTVDVALPDTTPVEELSDDS